MIKSLKDLVLEKFPEGHPLRDVVLTEREALTPQEFVSKAEVWIALLNRRT